MAAVVNVRVQTSGCPLSRFLESSAVQIHSSVHNNHCTLIVAWIREMKMYCLLCFVGAQVPFWLLGSMDMFLHPFFSPRVVLYFFSRSVTKCRAVTLSKDFVGFDSLSCLFSAVLCLLRFSEDSKCCPLVCLISCALSTQSVLCYCRLLPRRWTSTGRCFLVSQKAVVSVQHDSETDVWLLVACFRGVLEH